MMRLFYILFIFVLVASCGSKKKVTDTKINNSINEKINSIVEESRQKVDSIIKVSELNGKVIITEIEYDTTTPTDSTTNRPKVKKETNTTIDFSKKDSTNINSKEDDNIKSTTDESKQNNTVIENKEEEEKEESAFFYYLYRFVLGLIALTLIVFVLKVFVGSRT